jgi:predicted O-linked N-acetylglucosamine transferase (SPINDLY family)
MRILKAADHSVLWLLDDNAASSSNLRKEAASRGVDGSRIVFAPRVPPHEHLARQKLADLFLDTLPYNAHTTASDALWAELPLLTQVGSTFAGRVAASLLNAIQLPELITRSNEEYEYRAIELARNPTMLNAVKDKLKRNRLTTPLFDTPLFARHLEAAYAAMYQRYQSGLSPDDLEIRKSC